jgi:hypothetical protein
VTLNGSPVDALTLEEKGGLLDALLRARPDLAVAVKELAERYLETADRWVIAGQVAASLKSLDHEVLSNGAGYRPGTGYVDETQAALDILGETLQPFYDDLERRAARSLPAAASEIGLGIILGLYDCRDFSEDGTLLAYAVDYPADEARWVVQRLGKLGIRLPERTLDDLTPDWALR